MTGTMQRNDDWNVRRFSVLGENVEKRRPECGETTTGTMWRNDDRYNVEK